MTRRFAIYFAPEPGTLLHQSGSYWLGRDAFSGAELQQPEVPGLAELTAEPRRYGFHATLKAPFALADGNGPSDLDLASSALCAGLAPFSANLKVAMIDGFLAVVPTSGDEALNDLAERCVRDLDRLRRPATAADIARRQSAGLTPQQDAYLHRWGYPYVLDAFRFHMTLSRRLSDAEATSLMPIATAHFAKALAEPVVVDAVTIFEEAAPGSAFRATRRFAFRTPAQEVEP